MIAHFEIRRPNFYIINSLLPNMELLNSILMALNIVIKIVVIVQ